MLPEADRSPELAFKCLQDPLESSPFSVGILKRKKIRKPLPPALPASCDNWIRLPNPCSRDNRMGPALQETSRMPPGGTSDEGGCSVLSPGALVARPSSQGGTFLPSLPEGAVRV